MHHQVGPSQEHNGAVERVLRQAEMSRLTRNLKSKLALASIQAQHGPAASQTPPPPATAGLRKRAKTLEGASPAPRFMAASEPQRRPSQQKRYSLPAASPRGGSLAYRATPSRPSSRPLSRTTSVTAMPPMPVLPTFFVGDRPPYMSGPDSLGHGAAEASVDRSAAPSNEHTSEALENESHAVRGAPAGEASGDGDGDEPIPPVPQTPPQRRSKARAARDNPQTPERRRDPEDGASLLLHFAHSPGHAVTPRTPDFNMSDYLHFQTPSPARPARMGTPRRMNQWGSLTSLSSLSSNIFVPAPGVSPDSLAPTPVRTSGLLSPTPHPPMPSFPAGARVGLEKSPSDL